MGEPLVQRTVGRGEQRAASSSGHRIRRLQSIVACDREQIGDLGSAAHASSLVALQVVGRQFDNLTGDAGHLDPFSRGILGDFGGLHGGREEPESCL